MLQYVQISSSFFHETMLNGSYIVVSLKHTESAQCSLKMNGSYFILL